MITTEKEEITRKEVIIAVWGSSTHGTGALKPSRVLNIQLSTF